MGSIKDSICATKLKIKPGVSKPCTIYSSVKVSCRYMKLLVCVLLVHEVTGLCLAGTRSYWFVSCRYMKLLVCVLPVHEVTGLCLYYLKH